MIRFYRPLILTSLIFVIVDFWFNEFVTPNLTGDIADIASWDGYAGLFLPDSFFYYSYYVVQIVVLLGLYFYSRIARVLFFLSIIFYTLCLPFYGVSVQLPVQGFLTTVNTFIAGALIVMLFSGEIKSRIFA
jgi:hypothetical protein